MPDRKKIVVVGSVNLDIVVTVDRLPVAGETVSGGTLSQFPGGKGANQALAAKRLGADVSLVACRRDEAAATGVALIAVSSDGENQIVVVPGANRASTPADMNLPDADALICQLEVPVATLQSATESFSGFISINLAPAIDVPADLIDSADLVVVNETEAAFYGDSLKGFAGLLAITYGAKGAVLMQGGEVVARSKPPAIEVVDTTGAGDTFTAALTLAMIEGHEFQAALDFACAAGAAAATRAGAQPSLPLRAEVDSL